MVKSYVIADDRQPMMSYKVRQRHQVDVGFVLSPALTCAKCDTVLQYGLNMHVGDSSLVHWRDGSWDFQHAGTCHCDSPEIPARDMSSDF